jgi:hypothetical protein
MPPVARRRTSTYFPPKRVFGAKIRAAARSFINAASIARGAGPGEQAPRPWLPPIGVYFRGLSVGREHPTTYTAERVRGPAANLAQASGTDSGLELDANGALT